MFCPAGRVLLQQFQDSAAHRSEAKDNVLRTRQEGAGCEDALFIAKRDYNEALVAWVTHRAFCLDCRVVSLPHDLEQFASV